MSRTPVRIAVLIVALLLTAGIGYRAFQNEITLDSSQRSAADADRAAEDIEEALVDLRASMHAYLAPGQGLPFWAKRAQGTIDTLRQNLIALDALAAPFGASLAESLDGIDQLVAGERRARTYVSRGEGLLAGDVIFTEIRDILASATAQVDAVRADLHRQFSRRITAARREQMVLAAAALGLWMLVAVALLPVPAKTSAKDPAEWRSELKETLSKPIPVVDDSALPEPAPAVPAPPAQPPSPAVPSIPLTAVKMTSEICSDLSALADPAALDGALARISALLDATGLIVWVAANDGGSLSPVATHGFDPKLVSRIGRVPRDGANLTAAALRDNAPRSSAATASTPAALAVPMLGPTGPAGVLSIELKSGHAVDDAKLTLASILAAQLSTLAMPVPAAPGQLAEPHRAAV
ncbi:MAG TPA: GAF domain-containing protein [Vicinamibacterales bacterium]|nr:GAF domain-containing protein [Vicinamibacterales bacterium]